MKTIDLTSRMTLQPASQELTVQYTSGDLALGQTVGGLQAFSDKFIRGYGNNVFGSDGNGIWLGNADFVGAPFKVEMDGTVTMAKAVITGYTKNADVVTIIGNTVTATYVNALNIQATTVKSDWVYAGNLTADQITTGSMSANRITSGSMSASRISGGTLTLGGSGNGNGVLYVQNASNNNGIYMDNAGMVFYDDRFSTIIWGNSSGTPHGYIGYTSSTFIVGSISGADEYVASDGHLYLTANSSSKDVSVTANRNVNLTASNGSVSLSPGGSNKVNCNANLDMKDKDIDACTTIWAYNFSNRSDIRLKKNVEDLSVDINDIFRIIPVEYNFKHESDAVNKHYGFIAQEVESVYPNLVTVDEDGSKAINYNEMLAILFAMTKKIAEKVYGKQKVEMSRADVNKLPELVKKKPSIIEMPDFTTIKKNLNIKIKKSNDR